MNRRGAIAAVVVVTLAFFLIRVGVRLLAKEAAPPPSPVVDRSRSSPIAPPSPERTKAEAHAKLLTLASEARVARELKTATLAYDADRALEKNDCAGTQSALTRAGEALSPESSVKGAVESAMRSVNAYCATVTD